ncbi:hypothetical protein MAC_04940 [Metarhizium acridum CQMa 102]|uniref:Uncharacterized protein n=1 Tax=Metarhizium acridum (strain CQMa 102) TaxID=655827 RepID=E9E4Z2_METAQ|nr:uncharacterized protein MAC_04940 [Metarhizium acridum CQMa 102]EFY89009.1 hypothetical protein MAC_04940 [Metarhizium acridum CQMa 102]
MALSNLGPRAPSRPVLDRTHQKPNRIPHHVRAEPVPYAGIHPILDHDLAVPVPPLDRILQHPQERPRTRIRNQLVVAPRTSQQLLPPDARVENLPQPRLLPRRQRRRRHRPFHPKENGLGIVLPTGRQQIPRKVPTPQQRGASRVQSRVSRPTTHQILTTSQHAEPRYRERKQPTQIVGTPDDSNGRVDPVLPEPGPPRGVAAQTPAQADVGVDISAQIAGHEVHQPAHVARAALDHARHVDCVFVVASVPGVVGKLADQPRAVVGHVERQGHQTAGAGGGREVPRVEGATGDILHPGSCPRARVQEPKTGEGDVGTGELVLTVHIDKKAGHWNRRHGDGRRRVKALG